LEIEVEMVAHWLVHWRLKHKQLASQLEIEIEMVAHQLVHWGLKYISASQSVGD
jgi:hypothetical protein